MAVARRSSRFRPVFFALGLLLSVLAMAEIVPAVADLAVGNPDWQAFAGSAGLTLFVGVTLSLSTFSRENRLDLRQGFLLTVASWFIVPLIAALPFVLADVRMSASQAVFESVSGLTTTGSTVLAGLDGMPPGILMWRGLLQWLGGIGIIAMAVLMLPFLRVGGMQLFRLESSEQGEKILPRSAHFVAGIALVYLALTLACAVAYRVAGMTGFEAVVHAMTTVSTGGYSTSDASIAHFGSALVDWTAIVFMVAGSLPFALYIRMLGRRHVPFWRDSQVRAFLLLLAAASLLMAAWLWRTAGVPPIEAVTRAAFNVVSVVTTTGYATADYNQWGSFAVMLFFILTAAGGCTGSTAGGLKMLRLQIVGISVREQLLRMMQPRRVLVHVYNGRELPDGIAGSVMLLVVAYLATMQALALALAWLGLDPLTSFSGALTAIANVGPGLGPVIGPAGNFSTLPDGALWLLSFGMLLGRLEFVTVLVVLSPRFWTR